MKNLMKQKMKNNQLVLGSWITIPHPEVVEILSMNDFDWFLFDMEHAPITVEILENLLRAKSEKITSIVRVPKNDLVYIKQALDIGSCGVMVPMVNDVKEASMAVSYSKYPPIGIRGTGARRASGYYIKQDEYLKNANAETTVIVQIETAQAVNNFESIISKDGVDGWFIGPNDLAASLGHLGDPSSPVVMEAMDRMLKIGKKVGKPGGTLAFNVKQAKALIKKGFTIMAVSSDDFLIYKAANDLLKSFIY
ncbi:hypothetical protein SE19_08750 [Acidiplasma aeolicum]|uniref:HpcH/HpaI aldolase/citrate lyase domain-containing protein n=3 Tax=Acidiplasma TaxID=507753 RepID=A0A0P9CN58_9ARCH|nr:hypothetical protein TZ01_02500 [Acidiplasma sp. MBA-1]KPV44343.1 hypothetical protein SE19_08750 [Acidiplasma aeolicum]